MFKVSKNYCAAVAAVQTTRGTRRLGGTEGGGTPKAPIAPTARALSRRKEGAYMATTKKTRPQAASITTLTIQEGDGPARTIRLPYAVQVIFRPLPLTRRRAA